MRQNPERLAWRILLAAFLVFLLLCGTAIYATQWYLFRSMVELQVTLRAARGTVTITLPTTREEIAVSGERTDLKAGTTIRTDTNSQAVLTFYDPRSDEPIASVVVLRDSEVSLQQALGPRFGLNRSPFIIAIHALAGRSEVLILHSSERGVAFTATSPHAAINFREVGHYALEVTDRRTRVSIQKGLATVTDLTSDSTINLTSNRQTIVRQGSSNEPPVLEAEVSLLQDGDFAQGVNAAWRLTSVGEPAGKIYGAVIEGRPSLVIDRSQANWPDLRLDHGETRLTQEVNADISAYEYLELRGTFYVEEQSLSTCGIEGSECPMMIRLDYLDANGTERVFIHGFYAYYDPGLNYPLACDTCRTEHEGIGLRTWFTYRSGNLINILPPDQRPVFIQRLSFYASGHAYKVYVSEMDLLVARQ